MDPLSNDNNRNIGGLMNGVNTDSNEQLNVGVVKKSKQTGQVRNSASSQGSSTGGSIRDELTLRGGDSSSTSSADEGSRLVSTEKRRKRRKQRSVIHRQIDDDDERTDSAEEEEEEEGEEFETPHCPSHQPPTTYTPGTGITFDPASSILKPLSPSMLAVGYGAELMMTHPPVNQGEYATPIMSSPHQSEGSGIGLSPPRINHNSSSTNVNTGDHEGSGNQVLSLVPSSLPSLPAAVGSLSSGGSAATVLNPSSSTISAAANALPFAGWWGQHTTPIYSPFCGPSGSVATTPVATDTSGLLRPGSSVLLRAVICQETDGVLIVNVHWRNKSYSGSLIDVSQHQWAPPRLLEGFQELPIQVKDLYSKQESEKEAAIDVVIDEEKDEEVTDLDVKQSDIDSRPLPLDSQPLPPDSQPLPPSGNKDSLSAAETIDNSKATSNETKSDLLMKPPNGLKVPVVLSSSSVDKLKPVLPAFDAVKSPQPQIGRDDNESVSSKKIDPSAPSDSPSSQSLPETHHNLNTLVDVAAKMKHVSNDFANGKPPSPSRDEVKRSAPPQTVSGNESDSSGSGSISPIRKQHQQGIKEAVSRGTKEDHPPIAEAPPSAQGNVRQPETATTIGNSVIPFQFDTTITRPPPISPERQQQQQHHHHHHHHHHVERDDRQSTLLKKSSSSKQMGHSWVPPPPQDHINKKGVSTMPPPGMSMSNIIAANKPGVLPPIDSQTPPQPLPFSSSHHPPSVIQDKSKQFTKRKRAIVNEVNKRPSPPPKERDNSPVGTSSSSSSSSSSLLAGGGRPFNFSLIPGQEQQLPPPPPGFQYDPNIPMNYELQVVSYTREKAAEAVRNIDRNTPPSKIPKRQHQPYEILPSTDVVSTSRRSPPHISSSGSGSSSGSSKRNSSSTNSKISPGVVIQPDLRHPSGMMQHSPPVVKQEMIPAPNRPSRPPSKGGGPSHMSSKSGHSSRKPHPPPRRSEQHPVIKQEPLDHGQQLLHASGHPFAFQHMAFPLVINSTPSSTVSPQLTQNPSWGGVISNPSSQSHRRTPIDLSVSRPSVNRSPSPAPNAHRKSDWQSSHHASVPQQVKQEQIGRQGSNSGGDKHGTSSNSLTANHGGSSSSSSGSTHGHHSNKHDPSPSARHILTPSHTLQPTGATLSPSYIADLRNGVQMNNDWVKQMQLMQLEALHKGSIIGPAPPAATAIPTPVHPQELALWQNHMAAQMAAMQQLPVEQATALQMQLAIQQQQQQQQNEAVTQAFTAQGLLPLMHPFPVGAQVLPFSSLTQAPKRDS